MKKKNKPVKKEQRVKDHFPRPSPSRKPVKRVPEPDPPTEDELAAAAAQREAIWGKK